MRTFANIAVRALLAWIVLTGLARAHDHFQGVYEHNNPSSGRLCCGGSEDMNDPNADCEWLTDEQVEQSAQGLTILSRRYKAKVFVPHSRVEWDVPRNASGKPADPHGMYKGAWCGKPRTAAWPMTPDDPDPSFHTFCAFFEPGGV